MKPLLLLRGLFFFVLAQALFVAGPIARRGFGARGGLGLGLGTLGGTFGIAGVALRLGRRGGVACRLSALAADAIGFGGRRDVDIG